MRRAARRDRAHELVRLVGISPERIKSYPHELSGGMRQRAGIALALALSPQIIIMDEPTTALDVVVQREILSELLRLREQLEFAVIFITHDLSLLLELADRVAIMYAGRLVEQATQRDLYQTPRHPYSYGLINAFPKLRGPRLTVVGIPGTPPDLRTLPSGCAFHPRCPLAFEPCRTVTPQLRAASAGSAQLVACHLYDPAYRPAPPDTNEIADGYRALVEGSRV
jgi:peptide/nickel transport system ATP-binding protein